MSKKNVYIGLGSNIGNRIRNHFLETNSIRISSKKHWSYRRNLRPLSDQGSWISCQNTIPETEFVQKELGLKTLFDNLESQFSIDNIIFDLAPKSLHYKNLVNEYNNLRTIVKENSWGDKVPEDLVLGFQLKHKNVSILRSRLHRMGYLSFNNKSDFFDAELRSSVQLFQGDFGLNDDGVAGFFTLQAINVPAYTRLIQIAVNLERAKWLNFEEEEKYVLVNQPNFKAKMYDKKEVIWESRVVIGLPDHQTAEFNDEISHLIINPTWHVPKSITLDE